MAGNRRSGWAAGAGLLPVVVLLAGCATNAQDGSAVPGSQNACAQVQFGTETQECPQDSQVGLLQGQAEHAIVLAYELAAQDTETAGPVPVTQKYLNRAIRRTFGDPPPPGYVFSVQGTGESAGITVSFRSDGYLCTVGIGPDPEVTDRLRVVTPAVCSVETDSP